MKRLARICLWQVLLLALVGLLLSGVPAWADGGKDDDEQVGSAPRLYIEPIAGLTTIRHLAPASTAFPLGRRLDFFLSVPQDAEVSFVGATITSRDATGVTAVCTPGEEGLVTVLARTELADGSRYNNVCQLNVLSVPVREIRATTITPTVAPVLLDEDSTNMDTMAYFFGDSVAPLVEIAPAVLQAVSPGGRQSGSLVTSTPRYRTSTGRRIEFEVVADPPGFAPLMEWRIGGAAITLGKSTAHTFSDIGDHTVSVGPPKRSADAEIETYRVTITSHRDQVDRVMEGQSVTFVAVTDPPGYENEVLWVSSTKFGTASPVLGQGETFTCTFSDTYGDNGNQELFQWLGVRANNAVFGQDQKNVSFEGVTRAPGQSFHYHVVNLQWDGVWCWLWIIWLQNVGTIQVDLILDGELHLNDGEEFFKHTTGNVPYLDDEWFTNIGEGPQDLVGTAQVSDVGPAIPFNFPGIPVDGSGHILADVIDPSVAPADPDLPYEFWKTIANTSGSPDWWFYEEQSTFLVSLFSLNWFHAHVHFERLRFDGVWLWITNVGTENVSIDVHLDLMAGPPAE